MEPKRLFEPETRARPGDVNGPEVRRCAACGAAAVVVTEDWKHTSMGVATGQSTRLLRCQRCGASYKLRPRVNTLVAFLMTLPAALTIIGLPVVVLLWRRHTLPSRIPVVPGAPAPELRFAAGPPPRACTNCAATATVRHMKRTTINGMSSGTEYIYCCAGCSQEFTVHSIWSIVLGFLLSFLVGAAAWAFLRYAKTSGWRYGGAGVSGAITLLLMDQAIAQVRTRKLHPVVEQALRVR